MRASLSSSPPTPLILTPHSPTHLLSPLSLPVVVIGGLVHNQAVGAAFLPTLHNSRGSRGTFPSSNRGRDAFVTSLVSHVRLCLDGGLGVWLGFGSVCCVCVGVWVR